MSVDSITDLDDNQSRLLEALQLSLPVETQNKKEKHRDKRLSLNPIYRQVPRVVDSCCQHIEKYGKKQLSSGILHLHTLCYYSSRCSRQLLLFNNDANEFALCFTSLRPADCGDFQSGKLQEKSATGTVLFSTSASEKLD